MKFKKGSQRSHRKAEGVFSVFFTLCPMIHYKINYNKNNKIFLRRRRFCASDWHKFFIFLVVYDCFGGCMETFRLIWAEDVR